MKSLSNYIQPPEKFKEIKYFLENNVVISNERLKIIDVGGTAEYLDILQSLFPKCEILLFNIDKDSLNGAENVIVGDAQRISNYFQSETFDVVIALDMMAHLNNPDAFLSGVHSILKNDGIFLMAAANLSDFYSRLLFLFGYMPYSYTPSKYRVASPFSKIHSELGYKSVFTYRGLRQLLKIYGFNIIYEKGLTYVSEKTFEETPWKSRIRKIIGKILPKGLSEVLLIAAYKKK